MKTATVAFLAVVLALCVPGVHSQSGEVYLSVSKSSLRNIPKPADAVEIYVPAAHSAVSAGDLVEEAFPVLLRRGNGEAGVATAGLRGFSAKQTAVLLDGMRVPADLTGTVDLSALPGADIRKVEILPGAWSSVQGANAEGGVINFITREPGPGVTRASLSTGLSSYGGAVNAVSFSGARNGIKTSLSASRLASDGFQRNSAARKVFFSGKFSVPVRKDGEFSVTALRSNSEIGVPGGTPVPIADWDGLRERSANSLTDLQRSSLGLGRAALTMPLSEKVSYTLSAEGGVNRLFSHTAWGDELSRTFAHTALLAFSFNGDGEAGVEYKKDLLRSDTYGDRYMQNAAVFAQWALRPAKGLSIIPSFRHDSNVGYAGQASPRLAVIYAPGFVWKFSAQAGRAWQAPTFADLYNPWVPAADRSPDLKPEHSWQTQAALAGNFASGLWTRLGAYYSDVRERIALDPAKSWAAYNLDSAFNRGLEAGAGYKSSVFSAGLGYVHNVSKGRSTGGYQLLAFSPQHRFSLTAAVKTPWADIRSRAYYSSGQYTAAGRGGLAIPSYVTADLYLSRSLESFEIFAGADNILDAHYAQTADTINGYYPLPGRVYKCGLSVRFI
jgi:outer membrane receptor protein involved in Fe transport